MASLVLVKLHVFDHLQAYHSVLNIILEQSSSFLWSFTKLHANASETHQGLQEPKDTDMLARDKRIMQT